MTIPVKAQIIQKFEEFDTIIIHRHINPDPDAIGSQLGLKSILAELFDKKVYAVGEEAEGLQFMGRMDEVPDALFANSLCVVLDTANEKRISDDRYSQAAYVIKIDHHPDREPFGDISWVDTSYSSTCEMLTDLFSTSQGIDIPDAAAESLYTGFVGDTGRFLYSNTNSRTLYLASLLRKYSFDPQKIYTSFYTVRPNVAKAKAVLLQNMEINDSGLAYSIFSTADMLRLGVDVSEAANLVNEMSYIEGVDVWVLFVEDEGNYRVRLRSSGIPINDIAAEFNGGGHPQASGAYVEALEINLLLKRIVGHLKSKKDL